VRAYRGLIGAVLVDSSLWPLVRPVVEACPDADLAAVLAAIGTLYGDEEATIDAGSVVIALGDHPARRLVPRLFDYARQAEDPKSLLDGELRFLQRQALEREKRALLARIKEGDGDVEPLLSRLDRVSKGQPTALAD
jgi:hypothetical protein